MIDWFSFICGSTLGTVVGFMIACILNYNGPRSLADDAKEHP